MNRPAAVMLVLVSALLWSTGGLLIKSVQWDALGIAGTRSLIAATVLWVFSRKLKFTWSFAQLGGAITYAFTVTLFVAANKFTTAANAIFLQYTGPIYVAVFAGMFLGEKTTRWNWFMIAIALFGMALFFLDELTTQNILGNVFGILSGVSFGWMTLFFRKQKKESALESIILGNALAAGICLPFASASLPSFQGWLFLVLLGIGQLALPYFLYAKAIKYVTALEAIMIPFIEPILNPVWVLLALGELPGPMALLGGLIVLATVVMRALMSVISSSELSLKRQEF